MSEVLKKGIYTTKYEFTDDDNVVREIILYPLKGSHFKDFFTAVNKLGIMKGEGDVQLADLIANLDQDTTKLFHDMLVSTLKRTFPDSEDSDLEEFASAPVLVELNINAKSKSGSE